MNLEEMYEYFKNINVFEMYNVENKSYKVLGRLGILVLIIYMILDLYAIYKKINSSYMVILVISIILILISVCLRKKNRKKVIKRIEAKFNKCFNYEDSYSYFFMVKSVEFIKYLDGIGIKNIKQKELLAKLLYEKYNDTKSKNIWIKGAIIALSLPVWNNIIKFTLEKHMNNLNDIFVYLLETLGIIFCIILVIEYFRVVVYDMILMIKNNESRVYKEMYDILQMNILKGKSMNEYKGEITLVKSSRI